MSLWHAMQWPMHTRVRIVQVLMQPYVMYYLLLLDWKKCHLHVFEGLVKNFLWNKKHNRALVLSAWEFICEPKLRGGLGILHLHTHLQARRVAFIMRISAFQRPLWYDVFWKLIENEQLRYKGSWNLDPWNKFFSHAPLHTPFLTLNFLMRSFKKVAVCLTWNGRQRYVGNSFASLSPYGSFLSNPPLAFSLGASARYFNNKGIDSIAKCYDSKWEIKSFPAIKKTFAVGSPYRSKWVQLVLFIQQFQVPLNIDASDPWRDWLFARHTKWWDGNPSTFYASLLPPETIAGQCNARWGFKIPSWWHTRFHPI
ncbi:hypothetical protein KP509_1Z130900 [Ceratopteris richardii]|nr:hypothetical protein KP509_1Z130900 [Ceratopteris richardii]